MCDASRAKCLRGWGDRQKISLGVEGVTKIILWGVPPLSKNFRWGSAPVFEPVYDGASYLCVREIVRGREGHWKKLMRGWGAQQNYFVRGAGPFTWARPYAQNASSGFALRIYLYSNSIKAVAQQGPDEAAERPPSGGGRNHNFVSGFRTIPALRWPTRESAGGMDSKNANAFFSCLISKETRHATELFLSWILSGLGRRGNCSDCHDLTILYKSPPNDVNIKAWQNLGGDTPSMRLEDTNKYRC